MNRGLRSKVGCFDCFMSSDTKENIEPTKSGIVAYSVNKVQSCRFCKDNHKIYIGNDNSCFVGKQKKKLLISHSKKINQN